MGETEWLTPEWVTPEWDDPEWVDPGSGAVGTYGIETSDRYIIETSDGDIPVTTEM